MSVNEAIEWLERQAAMSSCAPCEEEMIAVMLHEAKVLIKDACDSLDTEGISEEFIQRADEIAAMAKA